MSFITLPQRLYLAAVGFLAITVGFWCYFFPAQSANGIPWTLPPLCATFLGSMYLSGAVYSVICIASRRWGEIKLFMPQCALWTGGLAIVSLFYISAFDFSRNQTQMWWLAYIVYPLTAIVFLWLHRSERDSGSHLPQWVNLYLRVQGSVMILLGLALLSAPEFMQTIWAWRTGIMMLQLYSMPLIAYGVGCWLMTRGRNWAEVRNALIALAIFFGAEFFASLRFISGLNGPTLSVVIWFAWLGVTSVALIALSIIAIYRTLPTISFTREQLSMPSL